MPFLLPYKNIPFNLILSKTTMNKLLKTFAFCAASCLTANADDFANISYGSAAAPGGAIFLGTDGAAADSITIGYFSSGTAANLALTNWNVIASDNSWNASPAPTGFNIATEANVNVTSFSGLSAWVLITDGSDTALYTSSNWATFSGTTPPATPTSYNATLTASDSTSTISYLGNVEVTNNAGFQSQGVSIAIVPEPSTIALLFGFMAFTWVAIRRRK